MVVGQLPKAQPAHALLICALALPAAAGPADAGPACAALPRRLSPQSVRLSPVPPTCQQLLPPQAVTQCRIGSWHIWWAVHAHSSCCRRCGPNER